MYPHIDIYKAGDRRKHVEVLLQAPLGVRILYGLARGIGAGLIGFAVIAVAFAYSPLIKDEILFRLGMKEEKVVNSGFGNLLQVVEADRIARIQEEAAELGVDSYFSLLVPKIVAASKVLANVDAANQKEYEEALQKGVAHAKGTYFPGQGKTVYLFAHSTDQNPLNIARYNAVFYLLRKLEVGDRIIVFFVDRKYEYEVTQKVITSADDVSWFGYQGDGETLVLQTCDPPGTSWKRLLVLAKPVGQN